MGRKTIHYFDNWWEEKTIEVTRPEADLFWMALICVGEDPNKRMKVEEILAMPKETTWAGYG
jgi:hypothetical protein